MGQRLKFRRRNQTPTKSISKSLLSQLGIHIILAKQEKIASNSLAKQLGINSNLANLPSARANIRARIRLGIRGSSFLSGALCFLAGLFVRLAGLFVLLTGFFILPSQKCQTLGDGLFFYLAYNFGSWQITRFAK